MLTSEKKKDDLDLCILLQQAKKKINKIKRMVKNFQLYKLKDKMKFEV